MGARRLIAATAPSFVLVDRLARCIGHLSLINVQARVGLHLMDGRPEQARAALATRGRRAEVLF